MFCSKVTLCSKDRRENKSTVIAPSRLNARQIENMHADFPLHALLGPTVVSGVQFTDPTTSQEETFFVFHRLSVRVQGEYCLLCHVVDMTRYWHPDIVLTWIPCPHTPIRSPYTHQGHFLALDQIPNLQRHSLAAVLFPTINIKNKM
jgi:hypothetical protein